MLFFIVGLLSAFLVTLLGFAGIRLRGRIRRRLVRRVPVVDDRAVERILETGVLVVDDDPPLDQEEIDEEERRFWSERWDEPEPW